MNKNEVADHRGKRPQRGYKSCQDCLHLKMSFSTIKHWFSAFRGSIFIIISLSSCFLCENSLTSLMTFFIPNSKSFFFSTCQSSWNRKIHLIFLCFIRGQLIFYNFYFSSYRLTSFFFFSLSMSFANGSLNFSFLQKNKNNLV